MSKVQFQAARDLIKQGKYEEAKTILYQIDHPKAQEWITKIDQRIDQRRQVEQLKKQAIRESYFKQIRKNLTFKNVLLVLLFVYIAIGLLEFSYMWVDAMVSPPPSYIKAGSDKDDLNRLIQAAMALISFFGALYMFKLSWRRLAPK